MSWAEGVRDLLRYSHGDHEEENICPHLAQLLCAASYDRTCKDRISREIETTVWHSDVS